MSARTATAATSQQHDIGRQQVEKELGDKVETDLLENVAEGPDAERAIERLARDGCKHHLHHLLRLHGRDDQGRREVPGREVRARHRLQDRADNVATYNVRFYEGRYVIGQIAAKMSKTGRRRLHRLLPDSRKW